jgi:hypothetical protein
VRTRDGRRLLNMRFVNYNLTDRGYYQIHDPSGHILTRNFCSELDADADFAPLKFEELADPAELPTRASSCSGVEDIRLFENPGSDEVRFIGTSMNYSPVGVNSMVEGVYDVASHALKDAYVIQSPRETRCEKNWVPVAFEGALAYIYKWNPLEVARVEPDEETSVPKLRVVASLAAPAACAALFSVFRGSSTLVSTEAGLLGVVHFSVSDAPRQYYHAMALLDRDTLAPLGCSAPFFFDAVGIEFCIGFEVDDTRYRFWISRFDRAPAMVVVDAAQMPPIMLA